MIKDIATPIDDKEMERKVRRAFDLEEGKTILVDFGDDKVVRVDYRCQDHGTDMCKECGIRFKCYLSQYLTIKFEDLNMAKDHRETINEAVTEYIKFHKWRDDKEKKSEA